MKKYKTRTKSEEDPEYRKKKGSFKHVNTSSLFVPI